MIPLNDPFPFFGLMNTSYRSPRLNVMFERTFQLSCANNANSRPRYSPAASVERPVAGSTPLRSEKASSSAKSRMPELLATPTGALNS